MKTGIKNILFALCALPLLVKFPYLISVRTYSPLEGADFIMWLAIPFVALACEILRRKAEIRGGSETYKKVVAATLLACTAAWMFAAFRMNAAGVILGIAILALGTDLRFGRTVFVSQLPTFLFAVMACPSLSYWLDYYLHIGLSNTYSYFAFKFIFAVGFLVLWCALSLKKRRYPRIWSIIFCISVCMAMLYNRIEANSHPVGSPLYMDLQKMSSGDWIAREDAVSEADKRFFSGCDEIVRKSYFNADSAVYLLGLSINKISNIHPVGICLKSSGFEVKSSRQIQVPLPEGAAQINELKVEKNGQSFAVYSWFSDGNKSTGDFARFRLQKSSSKNWMHYQIMTPISESSNEPAKRAKSFIETFKK